MASPFTVNANVALNPASIKRSASQLQVAFNGVRIDPSGLRGLERPLGKLTADASEFQKSLDAATARVFAFGATAIVLNGISQAFRGIIRETVNVQAALKDIETVGGLAADQMQRLRGELFQVAKNTAQPFSEVAEAAGELARQGTEAIESTQRLSDAMILSRITGLDNTTAVKAQTTALNAYKEAGLTSSQITNKIIAVDRAAAVSGLDLADSLSRVGSTAVDANVNFDELLALTTAIAQKTGRAGSVIGNALKSIFTRISRGTVLDQLQEFGIQIDAADSGISKLRKLASALEGITDPTIANKVKELAGGVFQINQVSAALSDLGDTDGQFAKSLEDSINAANEAYKVNEELNNTLKAQFNSLIQSVVSLGSKFGELAITDILTKIIKRAEELATVFSNFIESDFGKQIAGLFGKIFAGPGLAVIAAALTKILGKVVQFAAEGYRELINQGRAIDQLNSKSGNVNNTIGQQAKLRNNVLNSVQQQIELENRVNAILQQRNALLVNRPLTGNSLGAYGASSKTQNNKGVRGNTNPRLGAFGIGTQSGNINNIDRSKLLAFQKFANKELSAISTSVKSQEQLNVLRKQIRQSLFQYGKHLGVSSKELAKYNTALVQASQAVRANIAANQPRTLNQRVGTGIQAFKENGATGVGIALPFLAQGAEAIGGDNPTNQALISGLNFGSIAAILSSAFGAGTGLALGITGATITIETARAYFQNLEETGALEGLLFGSNPETDRYTPQGLGEKLIAGILGALNIAGGPIRGIVRQEREAGFATIDESARDTNRTIFQEKALSQFNREIKKVGENLSDSELTLFSEILRKEATNLDGEFNVINESFDKAAKAAQKRFEIELRVGESTKYLNEELARLAASFSNVSRELEKQEFSSLIDSPDGPFKDLVAFSQGQNKLQAQLADDFLALQNTVAGEDFRNLFVGDRTGLEKAGRQEELLKAITSGELERELYNAFAASGEKGIIDVVRKSFGGLDGKEGVGPIIEKLTNQVANTRNNQAKIFANYFNEQNRLEEELVKINKDILSETVNLPSNLAETLNPETDIDLTRIFETFRKSQELLEKGRGKEALDLFAGLSDDYEALGKRFGEGLIPILEELGGVDKNSLSNANTIAQLTPTINSLLDFLRGIEGPGGKRQNEVNDILKRAATGEAFGDKDLTDFIRIIDEIPRKLSPTLQKVADDIKNSFLAVSDFVGNAGTGELGPIGAFTDILGSEEDRANIKSSLEEVKRQLDQFSGSLSNTGVGNLMSGMVDELQAASNNIANFNKIFGVETLPKVAQVFEEINRKIGGLEERLDTAQNN